ncbi:hypothetical protein B0H17DRAFT_1188492, partial [Mycena rosella]
MAPERRMKANRGNSFSTASTAAKAPHTSRISTVLIDTSFDNAPILPNSRISAYATRLDGIPESRTLNPVFHF